MQLWRAWIPVPTRQRGPGSRRSVGNRVLLMATLALGSCDAPPSNAGAASPDRSAAARQAAETQRAVLPSPDAVARVAFRLPQEAEVRDSVVLASVRRGRALLTHTRDSLPRHVGNALVCTNCHLEAGTRQYGMPWVGVYARFPQYRSRAGATQLIEDRVNDCFKRSLNGVPLVPESRDMRDIVAYMAFLSSGYPVGAEVEGQGLPKLEPVATDTTRGRAIYLARCVRCHGADGEGTPTAPPVWGDGSFNIGAGMARVRTAATFIKHWMPHDSAGVLTVQEAYDVAAFVDAQPRPDFEGKERDWPHGDPPPDVAYPTTAASRARAGATR